MPISYPQINGHRFSHASLEISWNGIPLIGCSQLDFDDELAPGEVRGTPPQIIGRTRGTQKATASITLFREEWEIVRKTMGVVGTGYGETSSNILVTYLELLAIPIIDNIIGVRVTKAAQSSSSGSADPLSIKLDLMPMRIMWNGDLIATPINVGI